MNGNDLIDDREEYDYSEEERYFATMDALQSAKNLGLSVDHLVTLCRECGVQFDDLD